MATNAKQATQRAKEMLLGNRLQVIEKLARAHDDLAKVDERIERERATRDKALAELRDTYDEAKRAGWSTRELNDLGYKAPRMPNGQRTKTSAKPTGAMREDGSSGSTESADGKTAASDASDVGGRP